MDATTDVHPMRNDTSQSISAMAHDGDQGLDSDDSALNEDAVPNNFRPPPFDIHPSLVTKDDGIAIHQGHEEQSSIHISKSDQEPSDTLTASTVFDFVGVQSTPHQVIQPIFEDVRTSECTFVPADESTSVGNINESKADTITGTHSLEPLSSITMFPETASGDQVEPEPDESSLDLVHNDGLDCAIEEEHAREDFDDPGYDLPSSVPPSSSPPQLFSSSPCVSSQSSSSDVEPSKMLAADSEGITSSHDCSHADDMEFYEPSSHLESKNLHNHDIPGVLKSPGTDTYSAETLPSSTDRMLGLSGQRMASDRSDPDESYGSPPTKRQKLDLDYSSPPAPKRATVASQDRQFKKLTTPFRPPSLKLPVVMDGPAQARNRTEPNVRSQNDTGQNKAKPREPTTHPFLSQNKASNTARSVTQFKSPLVNRIISADTRAVRLTPAVQALERKLQLLKRAVKVKEDKEEDLLVRLAEKWIEAGREVAYDVWEAAKDAGELEGKATSVRRSHGWGSADDRSAPWGWDTKPESAGESGVPGFSDVPSSAERFSPEEDDDDTGRHTLGTMLRQLGIAPEIFGWDDDKEAFSDLMQG